MSFVASAPLARLPCLVSMGEEVSNPEGTLRLGPPLKGEGKGDEERIV